MTRGLERWKVIAAIDAMYVQINGRFGVGEVTRTDVAIAELAKLQARFDCGRITKAEYCTPAMTAVLALINGTREEANAGQRTVKEIVEAVERGFEIRNVCE